MGVRLMGRRWVIYYGRSFNLFGFLVEMGMEG